MSKPADTVLGDLPIAVVDIGSNSVRLNIYAGGRRSPALLYSEKSICRLGRGVVAKGVLAPEAVSAALNLLRRFGVLIRHMGVATVEAVATAAAREAENGSQFVTDAEQALGAPVRVLPGGEEGYLAALGVLSSLPDADGIVADLGGGSLELVAVGRGTPSRGETLPLGCLRLRDMTGAAGPARAIVEKALSRVALLAGAKGKTLYVVGGSWRALARIHMITTGYPLHMIDGYRISAYEGARIAATILDAPVGWVRETLEKSGTSSARQEMLPYAAVVLVDLLKRMQPEKVVFSASGLREGLVFAGLPAALAAQDPLVAGCRDLSAVRAFDPGQVDALADELFNWLGDVFGMLQQPDNGQGARLRRCICLLADIGRRAHPDFRGPSSLDLIAFAAVTGIEHGPRALLALAVYFSHKPQVEGDLCENLSGLLDDDALILARQLGAALRLAQALGASRLGILSQTRLAVANTRLTLTLTPAIADLGGLRVEKRLSYLAGLTGHDWSVELEPVSN